MYAQDENATHTQLYTSHFDLMKMTAGKRSPPIKPLYASQVTRAGRTESVGARSHCRPSRLCIFLCSVTFSLSVLQAWHEPLSEKPQARFCIGRKVFLCL